MDDLLPAHDAYEEIFQRLLKAMNVAPDSEVASTLRKFPPSIREQLLRENTVDFYKAFGQTRIDTLINQTVKKFRKTIKAEDSVLPFSVHQAQVLMGFQIDLIRMLLEKMNTSSEGISRNLDNLRKRIDSLSEFVQRPDVIEE